MGSLPEKKMYSKTRHEVVRFCNFCGLFSRSEANSNRKSIYICNCQDKPSSKLKFCDRCNLYLDTSIEAYRCKCTEVFSVPKIVELDHSPINSQTNLEWMPDDSVMVRPKPKTKTKTKPKSFKKKTKKKAKSKSK